MVHVFCRSCVLEFWSTVAGSNGSCPTCRRSIVDRVLIPPDRTLLRLLGELTVRCPRRAAGCTWTGPRSNATEHLTRNCKTFACLLSDRGCEWRGTYSSRDAHLTSCEYVDVRCPYAGRGCGFVGELRTLPNHLSDTPSADGRFLCPIRQRQVVDGENSQQSADGLPSTRSPSAKAAAEQPLCDRINPCCEDMVTLFVQGQLQLSTRLATLRRYPDSVLARVFTAPRSLRLDSQGRVLLDCHPASIQRIVNWLRYDIVPDDIGGVELALLLATARELELYELITALGAVSRSASPQSARAPEQPSVLASPKQSS